MLVPAILFAAASTTPGPPSSPPTEIDAEGAVADTNDEHTSDSRIVGGSTIDISDAPHQAFIADVDLSSGRFTAFCGGSIYQTQWVITAAHCVERATTWPFGRLRVGVGTSDLTSVPLSRLRAVPDIIIHPGWNASTFQNDIALLRLSEPVPIEAGRIESVSLPISLPVSWPSTGTTGRVAGWGLVRHGTNQASSVLQSATVRVLTEIGDPDCGRYGDYDSLYRAESMLCAGVPEAAVGVCRGDSGGGLVVQIGAVRAVCIRTGQAAANIIVDLMGYYPATGSTTALAPTRVFDSRAGTGRINAGATVPVALDGSIPTDATTALLNVTVANADADGYVTVAPCGQAMPATSNVNFVGITTSANNVITAIGSDRSICIRPSQAAADIIVDLVGVATD